MRAVLAAGASLAARQAVASVALDVAATGLLYEELLCAELLYNCSAWAVALPVNQGQAPARGSP